MTEHQSIQRWKILTLADHNGDLVDYADHVAAVAEAERSAWDRAYAAALNAAREAVATCHSWEARSGVTGDPRPARIVRDEALAAIDALCDPVA